MGELQNLFALSSLLNIKRKVFTSFHHGNDRHWFDLFNNQFGQTYDVFYDNSVDGSIRSNDPEYVERKIREDYIIGSSITVVLCGEATHKRKYVDWEINSTLYNKHALLGVLLPRTQVEIMYGGQKLIPWRLHDNCVSGYAKLINWPSTADELKREIEYAIRMSESTWLLKNDRPKMAKNSQ